MPFSVYSRLWGGLRASPVAVCFFQRRWRGVLQGSAALGIVLSFCATALLFAQSTSLPIIGISRHALVNNGRIEGSAQQYLGESNNINSSANFFGDFFVPGTPNVNVNGAPVWNGVQVGGGSVNPSGYSINVNSGAHLDHLVTRTDPGMLNTIPAPPNPSGSRNITIDNPGQAADVGDWVTVRNLNLNSGAGNVAVPPGTYGNFTASNSNGSGFVFGVAGSSAPAVYNLQQLTLNSNSRLTLVGPVIIIVKGNVAVNSNTAILGSSDNQAWLQLYSSNGGFSVNAGSIIYGEVKAPSGHINLNGTIVGTAAADYLTVNSTGVLKPGVTNRAPLAQDDFYSTDQDTALVINAPGVLANDSDPDGDMLSAVKVTDPAYGTLTFNANGSFTYVPAAGYHGTDSFTYKAGDGTLFSDIVTVHITINAVNHAPVAQDGTLVTDEDAPKAGQLNATDIDGDALTYSIVTPPQHGTVQLQQNGAYTYTPEADYNGADSFVFKANDGTTDSNHATISITVNPLNDAPVAADDSYTTPKNTALHLAAPGLLANDSDVDGDALTAAVETQPAHGMLTLNADGGLTYTPQAGYVGDDSFTYRASDGTLQSNIATVTIAVTFVNTPPTAQDGNVTTDEDTAVAVTLQGDDADGDTLIYTIVTPPQHGTLSGDAPDLTYTPNAGYSGADSFTFKANDGNADSNIATVTITITHVNHAPVAQESTFTLAEDTELQAQTTASDADGDALTYQLVTDTQHGTLVFNSDGSFTYTPDANYNGADSFTFKANDGTADSNIAAVHLTITPVNDAPVAQDNSYSTPEDVPLIVPAPGVLDNDTDIDGDTLTAVVETAPSHGTLTLNDDGSFTYIPDADYNGPDSFTYRASDGALQSNIATVTLAITPVNDAPLAQNGAWAIDEDTFLQGAVQATDADGDALTFAATTQPQHGTLIFNSDGTFTYTPHADYNGTDSFLFTANDGQVDSNPAVVTITVNPVNDAPLARDDVYQVAQGQILRVSAPGVLANDTDPDNDPLTASVLLQPAHGTLIFYADGSFIYQPQENYRGPDSFVYEIDDGQGGQATGRVTLIVVPVNRAPVAVDDTAESPGTALDIAVLANDTDPDGDPLTVVSVEPDSDDAEVSINPDGTVRYVPSPGFDGTFTFTYVISDPGGLQSAATVTVTMAQPAPIDTRGTEFWLAFPGNLVAEREEPRLVLSISAQAAATGQVEVPAIGLQQSFSLIAGQNVDIELPEHIQIDSDDTIGNLAIHVTSDNPISVYGVNFSTAQTEGYLGLPVRSLGTEYIILSYTPLGDIPSQLSLVGAADNTQVTIVPSAFGGTGRQANVPYTITLNQGQTYQLRSYSDLTGSVVTSTKPVSVYGGDACTNVPPGVRACNQLVEQLLPTNAWGSEFFTMPLATRNNGDTFRFLAQTDGTTVSINGTVVATLNRGQYHEQIIDGPMQITSSRATPKSCG